MTNLQQAIAVGSMIGSILSEYKGKDNTGPVQELKRVIKRMMFRRSRTNAKEFRQAISIADVVWRDAVNHFADKGISIEAISTVVALHNLYAEPLAKFADITQNRIDAYAITSTGEHVEHEQNSYMVSDYIIDRLAEYTGVVRRDLSAMKRKAETIANLKRMDDILSNKQRGETK